MLASCLRVNYFVYFIVVRSCDYMILILNQKKYKYVDFACFDYVFGVTLFMFVIEWLYVGLVKYCLRLQLIN